MTKASLLDALIRVRTTTMAYEAIHGRSREASQVLTKIDEARLWAQELPDPSAPAQAHAPSPIPPIFLAREAIATTISPSN